MIFGHICKSISPVGLKLVDRFAGPVLFCYPYLWCK